MVAWTRERKQHPDPGGMGRLVSLVTLVGYLPSPGATASVHGVRELVISHISSICYLIANYYCSLTCGDQASRDTHGHLGSRGILVASDLG